MSKFDIVCGEFQHSWVSASVYFEAIVSKAMLMCFRDDKDFEERKNLLYPIINAKNPKNSALSFTGTMYAKMLLANAWLPPMKIPNKLPKMSH